MTDFLIYILGVIVYDIGYFAYQKSNTKKSINQDSNGLILYQGLKYGGFLSWISVLFWIILAIFSWITYGIFKLDNFIESKLK